MEEGLGDERLVGPRARKLWANSNTGLQKVSRQTPNIKPCATLLLFHSAQRQSVKTAALYCYYVINAMHCHGLAYPCPTSLDVLIFNSVICEKSMISELLPCLQSSADGDQGQGLRLRLRPLLSHFLPRGPHQSSTKPSYSLFGEGKLPNNPIKCPLNVTCACCRINSFLSNKLIYYMHWSCGVTFQR